MLRYLYLLLFVLLIPGPAFADNDAEEDRAQWLDAAREANIGTIKSMLNSGYNIETATDSGNTALKIASKKGHLELAEFLIAQGADVNSVQRKKRSTPLHGAAYRGRLQLVKLLMQHGANIDAQTKKGNTPLNLAAKRNHHQVVDLLLRSGARIELQNSKGRTPLATAANNSALESVQLLLAKGADPLLLDNNGTDVVHQSDASSNVRDIVLGTMNSTSIVFNLPRAQVDDATFASTIPAVLNGRGWSPAQVSANEFNGYLQDDERIFRVNAKRLGDNLLLKFHRGYGSNKNYYLKNIKADLLLTLKLAE